MLQIVQGLPVLKWKHVSKRPCVEMASVNLENQEFAVKIVRFVQILILTEHLYWMIWLHEAYQTVQTGHVVIVMSVHQLMEMLLQFVKIQYVNSENSNS